MKAGVSVLTYNFQERAMVKDMEGMITATLEMLNGRILLSCMTRLCLFLMGAFSFDTSAIPTGLLFAKEKLQFIMHCH